MEGAGRAAIRTQSREEWWRGPGWQPNALRASRIGGGGQEGSQMHSDKEGVYESRRAANHTQSREKCRRAGGQPNTLRAAKHTQRRGEWWRGAGGQPSTLRAGRSVGGGREGSQAHSEPRRVVEGGGRAAKLTQSPV